MTPEIRALISPVTYHIAGVCKLAELLPDDEGSLDEWIAAAVRDADRGAFILLATAALHKGLRVDARHLARGTALLPHNLTVGAFAWHMSGDVDVHLLAAVRNTQMKYECAGAALFCAVEWAILHRNGEVPAGIAADARKLAREGWADPMAIGFLYTLGRIIPDEATHKIIAVKLPGARHAELIDDARVMTDGYLVKVRESVLRIVPAEYEYGVGGDGSPVRRAVARIGRNEQCPCGSGRKYKNCCIGKDQERLLRSSEVPGKTIEEVNEAPEPHITLKHLPKLEPWELARLDPLKLKPEILVPYMESLSVLKEPDAVVSAFERLGFREEFDQAWGWASIAAYRAGRKDAVERLVAVRGGIEACAIHLGAGARLILHRDDPAAYLREVEALALECLKTEDKERLVSLAHGVLATSLPALGIFVARGVIPLVSTDNALLVLNRILATHDSLDLSPDDPFTEIVEKRLTEKAAREKGKDSAPLREARRRLEEKASEVHRVKAELLRLRNEMEQREKKRAAAPQPRTAAPTPPADDSSELRHKINDLKARLNDRHAERTQLRKELQEAHAALSLARSTAHPQAAAPQSADTEDECVLPEEEHTAQPLRLIEFPTKFHATLDSLPRTVGRAALQMLGRLAAGEPAAYVGVVRLKAAREIWRQRIGGDHRLLFRLTPTHVQVVDLINRRDLDLRIKTLGPAHA